MQKKLLGQTISTTRTVSLVLHRNYDFRPVQDVSLSGLNASTGIEVKVHCRSDRTQTLWTTIYQADEGTSESSGHPQNMRDATSATLSLPVAETTREPVITRRSHP